MLRHVLFAQVLLSMIWLAVSSLFTVQKTPSLSYGHTERVSLCELVKNWKKYDHKTVQVDAVYAVGAESSEIYDVACTTNEPAWVPPDFGKVASPIILDQLRHLLESDHRVRIVVVGEFDGPKKVDVPPNTSPGVADTLRRANSQYGHQNGWDFQFIFSRIEEIDRVEPNEPWPNLPSEKKLIR
jgi:hypothetical protein